MLPTAVTAPLMSLCVDDKGRKPPPVLWELIKVTLTLSQRDFFDVVVVYGPTLNWTMSKSLSAFVQLHLSLLSSQSYLPSLPEFLAPQLQFILQKAKSAAIHTVENIENRIGRQYNLFRSAENGAIAEDLHVSPQMEQCARLEKYLRDVIKAIGIRGSLALCQFCTLFIFVLENRP